MNIQFKWLILLVGFLLPSLSYSVEEMDPHGDEIIADITPITDDLYRFQFHHHVGVFLVTDEGIALVDITNDFAANLLRSELKKRFNKSVTHLIYSHEHGDHIGGAGVFAADGATIIAHEETRRILAAETFEPAKLPLPDITFNEEMTLELGGKTIHMIQIRPSSHSEGLIAVNFVDDKTLFIVDQAPIDGVSWMNYNDTKFTLAIDAIKFIEKFEFDHLASGHYRMATKKDLVRHRNYLEDLHAAVSSAIDKGLTIKEAKETIRLDKYKDFFLYDEWLSFNVEGAYRSLKLVGTPDEGRLGRFKTDYEDPDNNREMVVTCAMCHGGNGRSPNPAWPNLAGQNEEYLLKALYDFYKGKRYNTNMSGLHHYTIPEELPALAEYYSKLNTEEYAEERAKGMDTEYRYHQVILPVKKNKRDKVGTIRIEAPKPPPEAIAAGKAKSVVCQSCHNHKNDSIAPLNPRLAGQNMIYLMTQLEAFRDGSRVDPVMQGMAKPLTDQDIAALAAYYSSL